MLIVELLCCFAAVFVCGFGVVLFGGVSCRLAICFGLFWVVLGVYYVV